MFSCEYCGKSFELKNSFVAHTGHCTIRREKLGLKKLIPWSKGKTKETDERLSLVSERQKGRKILWKEKISKTRKERIKKGLIKKWNLGKTKENNASMRLLSESCKKTRNSPEYIKKRQEWIKSLTPEERKTRWATCGNAGHKQSAESIRKNKEHNSETISKKIINGEIRTNGWAQHGYFVSSNGMKHRFDSKYEKERMEWLDKNGYIFCHNPFRIPYIFNNEKHYYIPDLFIVDLENANVWLEEIKSKFTLNKEKEKNEKKFAAAKELCKKMGIEFHVYNKDEYSIKENFDFDEIESIEEVGEEDYYGFCSPIHKNMILDGVLHHNSGKDTISCHAVLYCVYLLLCCKNPCKLFRGIDASSFMDIVNVAYNKTQSTQVFFTKLVESVKNWKWLRNKYRYVESGKSKKLDKKYANEDIVNIKAEEIVFPKHIRAVSRCSQQNAAEGLNVLLYILDEFSAFSDKNNKSNAMEMFNTLRTSSITRFGNQAKGFVISFPRYQGDPILKLAEMYKDDLNVYVDIASTFEVKPKSCFCDKWVDWEGNLIPEDFLSDFIKDPENSKAKFLCQPPEMADPFFTDTQKIDESIDKNRKQLFEVRDKYTKDPVNGYDLIGKEIIGKNYNNPDIVYCIGGDIGYSNDLTSLTIWHKEVLNTADGQEYVKLIQDCLITWQPNKDKRIQVDVANIEEIIADIIFKWKLPISGFYFDHYNTATLMQNFRKRGVNAQAYTLTVQDFYDIRTKLYSGMITFLDNEEQTREMKRLINTKQGKPDHITGGHDDMFRSNCLAMTMLDGDFKNKPIVMNDDGLFINKRLTIENNQIDNDFDGTIVKGRFHKGGNNFDPFSDSSFGGDDFTGDI